MFSEQSKVMTTMDSDSESQDSDDGRRFRFEATRKDATLVSQNRKRVSPHSGRSDQRSRSRGRSDRDRRDTDRALNRNRDSCSRYSSSRNSRDRDSKDRRDRHSSKNYLNDSKDAHDSKHLKHRNGRESNSSLTQKDSKEIKDSRDILSKNSRSHEKDSGNSRESRSSRDRNGKRSRDRSRSDRSSSDKHKIKSHEKNKHPSKDNQNRVKEDQVPEKSDGDANASLALGQIVNDLDKEVADTTQDGCIEFNISDFEIVSDTENSSDASDLSPGQRSKVKKCHSKQQSQQLSDKDSKRKSHRSEKLRKVNPRNGNHSSASSNSNPNALSDFSLGSASPTASSQKKIKEDEEAVTQMEVDAETSHDSSFSPDKVSDDCCTYGPILPPKTVRSLTPDYDKEMTSEISIKVEDSQNEDLEIKKGKKDDLKSKIDVKKEKLIGPPIQPSSSKSSDLDLVEYNQNVKNEPEKVSSSKSLQDEVLLQQNSQSRIVGPTLPAYLLSQKTDIDEDAFGPALPPHLLNKEKTDLENKIIGPMLPSEFRSEGDGESPGQLESDDEDIIGPLPADHPAAKSSIVQQSLEYRAMRIQSEFMSEVFFFLKLFFF